MEINITDANFEQEVLKSDLPVLIDFWATWCSPCQAIGPIVEKIAEEYTGRLKVCKLNIDEAKTIASKYDVVSIPTLMVFKEGKPMDMLVGVVPEDEIKDMINDFI